ncbi:MAG: hypothetical protein OXG85_08330 [Chloroflexi bacterium]|nr:hypothetical protein [Chloroflexota bacterium]
MTETVVLDLDKLNQALPRVRASLINYIYDAAVFLLNHHRHQTGLRCEVRNLEEKLNFATLVWTRPYSESMINTFGDTDYAVEFAAEGMACLTIRATTKYTAIKRSQRNDGVDFWLAESDDLNRFAFQFAARMESKGITKARYPSDIKAKVDEGIIQSKRSDETRLPAYIIVTDFGEPVIVKVQR